VIAEIIHPVGTPLLRASLLASTARHFAAVHLMVRAPDPIPRPTLILATHVSWWDGHLALAVTRALRLDFRVFMLSRELRRFPFLRYAGGFGFEPRDAADVRAAMRHGAHLLGGTLSVGLLLFPSGEIVRPGAEQPFRPGGAWLASQAAPTRVRPLALRLAHGGLPKPEAYLRLGAAREIPTGVRWRELTETLHDDLTAEAVDLDRDVASGDLAGYRPALPSLPTAPELWGAVATRLGASR
jgi:1-acyl-sn-glycerol-3-phosphate acyltransferase